MRNLLLVLSMHFLAIFQIECLAMDLTDEPDFSESVALNVNNLRNIGLFVYERELEDGYRVISFSLSQDMISNIKVGEIKIGLALIDKEKEILVFVYNDFFKSYDGKNDLVIYKPYYLNVYFEIKSAMGTISAGRYLVSLGNPSK